MSDLSRVDAMDRAALVRRGLLVVLCLYWIALFIGTHLPPRDVPNLGTRGLDKVVHFLAYGGLAFLLSAWLFTRKWSVPRVAVVVLTVLVTYAIADELLQILVSRNADVWDWLADTFGTIAGIGFAAGCRALLSERVA